MKRVLPLMTMLLFILGQGKAQIVEVLFSQSSKCVPSTVNFTNNSANRQTLLSIRWNWGDGTPDFPETVQPFNDNPTHVYTNPGTYKVTVTLEYPAPAGFKIDTSITIEVVPNPVFTFSMDADTVCPGVPIQFSSVLTSPSNPGDIQSYFWDFGSGQSSTQANPTNSYENPQNIDLIPFSTSLVITDKNGCQSTVSGGSGPVPGITYIGEAGIVRIWRKPDVDFQTSVGSLASFCVKPGAPPELVTFVNQTDNKTVPPLTNSNTYVWDFGDGGTSNLTNPTHSFGEGYWNVTLTATSPRGCVNDRVKGSVSVVNFEVLHSASKTVVLCDVPDAMFTIQGENIIGTSYFLDFNDMHTERMGAWSPQTHRYINEGTYTVILEGTHPNGQCSAKDTIIVHAYKPIDAVGIVTDTNMCEKDSAVYFRDVTKYNSTDDFGKYNVAWSFGGTGSPARHVFGVRGDYVVSQTVTTPYGCVLETIEHNIHIFPLHTVAMVADPAPPNPPAGCVPLSITLQNIDDSLITSSPIDSFIWLFDRDTLLNKIRKTSYSPDSSSFNTGTTNNATFVYQDTGIFNTSLILVNRQLCRDTIFVATIRAGVEPVADFAYKFTQDCNSVMSVQVTAHDSTLCPLFASPHLIQINPYGAARANDATWIDPAVGMPIASGLQTSLSFSNMGYADIIFIPIHNGCSGPAVSKERIGYVCPPVAAIDWPTNNPDGSPPVFCWFPNFCDVPSADGRADGTVTTSSMDKGAMEYWWYMGNANAKAPNFLTMQDSVGPFYTFSHPITGAPDTLWTSAWKWISPTGDTIWLKAGEDTLWTKAGDTAWVSAGRDTLWINRGGNTMWTNVGKDTMFINPWEADPNICFDYMPDSSKYIYKPDSSLQLDPDYYIYKNGGVVVITLRVSNWDSTSNEYLKSDTSLTFYGRKSGGYFMYWDTAAYYQPTDSIFSAWRAALDEEVYWDGSNWDWSYGAPNGYDADSGIRDCGYIYTRWEEIYPGDYSKIVWDSISSKWIWTGSYPPLFGFTGEIMRGDDYINGTPHPTYNRCGHCVDEATQVVLISDAQMRLVADKYDICQGDEIFVYDSSICTISLIAWDIKLINPSDPSNVDYPINRNLISFYMPEPIPRVGEGYPLYFTKPNDYDAVLTNMCAFECIRYDTVRLTIWPRSVPAFTSSKIPNGVFNFRPDTLCLNNPDSLYLRDASYTAAPFASPRVNVVKWAWSINRMLPDTLYDKNPAFVGDTNSGGGRSDVILTVTNDKGCDSTFRFDRYVLLNRVNASFQPLGGKEFCNKNQVVFRNLSSVLPSDLNKGVTKMACTWDFGDGTPKYTDTIISEGAASSYATHKYDLPNLRNKVVVTLTVSAIGLSCENIFVDTIYINRPISEFTQDENEFPCPGNGIVVSFQSLSQGAIKTYEWNFGDTLSGSGIMSSEENPIHTYVKAGIYDVFLVVEDSTGCVDSMVKPRHIRIDGPAGEVTYSPTSGCVPLSVTFKPDIMFDPFNPGNNTYSADFLRVNPDGGTMIERPERLLNLTFSHLYISPGEYYPYFYLEKMVKTGNGEEILCIVEWQGKDPIWVIDAHPNFISDSLYCMGAEIVLENTTRVEPSLAPDSIYWDYGDGNSLWIYSGDTISPDGYPVYDSDGSYNVTLIEYYKLCSRDTTIRVSVMPWPDLYFTPDSAIACDGLEVEFMANNLSPLAASRISQYEWRFIEDSVTLYGNPAMREFDMSNIYHYELEILFKASMGKIDSACVKTWEDSVVIFTYPSPIAEFTADPEEIETGGTIKFTDKSGKGGAGGGDIINWDWDFGYDGNEGSDEQNPSHTYSTVSGFRTVSLIITDEYGCKGKISHQITVTEKLNFPNIFTPNGSGGQKYIFRPLEDKGFFKEFELAVYDKWGMLIWSQKCTEPNCPDYQNEKFWWDGKNKRGTPVADGVYFWVVYAKPQSETKNIIQNGSVTVVNSK